MTYKKTITPYAKLLFAPIVTISILAVLLSRIDIDSVYLSLSQADIRLIIIAMILSLVTNFVTGTVILRQSLIISGIRIPFREALLIKLGNYPIQNILPMKLGEISVPIYLNKRYGHSIDRSVYSALIKNIMLIATLLAYAIAGLSLIGYVHPLISAILIILIFSIPFIFLKKALLPFIRIFSSKIKMLENIDSLIGSTVKKSLLKLLILTLVHMCVTIFNYYLMIISLGLKVPISSAIAFVPMILIIGRFPISLAGIGIRESSVMIIFSRYAASEQLFSAGLLFSAIDYILPSIVGILFTNKYLSRFSNSTFKQEQ